MTQPFKIRRSIYFVEGVELIRQVVEKMIEQEISSVLVLDTHGEVAGIITERDIVRKFTLLEKQDKLLSTAFALMSRPVRFVRLDHLHDDLRELHFNYGLRHFPVCSGSLPPTRDQIVGMMTTTDLTRRFLKRTDGVDLKGVHGGQPVNLPEIVLFSGPRGEGNQQVVKLLQELGCHVKIATDPLLFMEKAAELDCPVLIDLDKPYGENYQTLIQMAGRHNTHVIYMTQNLKLGQQLRSALKNKNQHVMIKPLDISFLSFLVNNPKLKAS